MQTTTVQCYRRTSTTVARAYGNTVILSYYCTTVFCYWTYASNYGSRYYRTTLHISGEWRILSSHSFIYQWTITELIPHNNTIIWLTMRKKLREMNTKWWRNGVWIGGMEWKDDLLRACWGATLMGLDWILYVIVRMFCRYRFLLVAKYDASRTYIQY